MIGYIFYVIFYVLLLFAVLIFGAYICCLYNFEYWKREGVEYLKPSFPFGNLGPSFLGKRQLCLQFAKFYKEIKGHVGGIYFLNQPVLIIKDLEIVKNILVRDFSNFRSRAPDSTYNERLAGQLFRIGGQDWKFLRSKLSPAFTIKKLKMMFESLEKSAKQMEDNLEKITQDESSVNITEISLKFTADTIASVIFGLEINSFEDKDNNWWKISQNLSRKMTFKRAWIFWMVAFVPHYLKILRINTVYLKSHEAVFNIVKKVVEHREKNNITRNDVMQLLIQLKNEGDIFEERTIDDDNGQNKSKTIIRRLSIYEVSSAAYSFFFAGFDTSANTISWCLNELSLNLEIQHRVQTDIDQTLAKYGGNITYDSIMDMKYLEAVINETLRMYPIAGLLNRNTLTDYHDSVSGLVIKKNTPIVISIYGMHHDPEYFPNPEIFDPDRFDDPEKKANIPPFAYLPFGAGPRNCIGLRLGYLETAVGLVYILKKYSVRRCEKNNSKIKFYNLQYTLSPKDPIFLRFLKRKLNG